MKGYRKALPFALGLLVLTLVTWAYAPRGSVLAQDTTATPNPSPTSSPLSFPPGMSANEKAQLQLLYDFNPDISSITTGSLTGSDRAALDVMWAQNYDTLEMIRVAMNRAENSQVRDHVRLLYQMRQKDQILLNQIEKQVGPVGGTATPTAAVTATQAATVAPTGTSVATAAPTSTSVATTAATSAATASATSAATAGPTTGPSSTTAATSAAANRIQAMEAAGAVFANGSQPVSLNNVPVLPGTALGQLGFQSVNLNDMFLARVLYAPNGQFDLAFDMQMTSALNLAEDTANVVQTGSSNPVLQAVARHLYQEDGIDLLILQILGDRVFFDQDLIVSFPAPPGVPGQATPTPASTESATPAASGTSTATLPASGTSTATPAASGTSTVTPSAGGTSTTTPPAGGTSTATP